MSRFRNAVLTVALLAVAGVAAAQSAQYPGVGRMATPKEVAKWDIDVRPDFKGLPAGSGSVAKGQDVWEGKCAHCHGVFGESGEVFSPLIGGTTAEDIKAGRVANLNRSDYPGRTTIMKVATVSTLWDYINRAMPWTNPKSLTTEEVYSVTAFLLNLANIVPDNYVLSDKNIAEVQARMPNRNGMSTAHAMWPGNEFGGVKNPDTANKLQRPNMVNGLFRDIVDTPRLSGTRRYLFADAMEAPVLEVAFLDGSQTPYLEVQNGFDVDGARYKVRLDYGVGAVDYRGAVTNAGA